MKLLENIKSQTIYTYGRNSTVGTSLEEVYDYSNTIDWLTVMNPPAKVDITSSSTNDVSNGTGARTLRLVGFDENGKLLTEIVSLNGQTIVQSNLSYKVLVGAEVLTTGSGKTNAGDIHIVKTGTGGTYTAGVPGTTTSGLLRISSGLCESMNGLLVVPEGFTARISYIEGIARTQPASIYVAIEPLNNSGPIQYIGYPLDLGSNSQKTVLSGSYLSSIIIPEKYLIRLRTIAVSASASVVATMQIRLVSIIK